MAKKSAALAFAVALGLTACGSDDTTSESPAETDADAPADTAAPEPNAEPEPEPVATESAAPTTVAEEAGDIEPLSVVVTASIHGDIVRAALGDAVPTLVEVEVVMPLGADPHDFAPSARDAEAMEQADLLVVNGLGLEEGLAGVIDAVADSGTRVFAFTDHAGLSLEADEGHSDHDHGDEDHGDEDHGDEDHDHGDEDHGDEDHGDEDHGDGDHDHGDEDHGDEDHDHGDEDHGDEDHGDEDKAVEDDHDHDHDHDHGGVDPHVWMDPMAMVSVVEALGDELIELGLDASTIEANIADYVEALQAKDDEVRATLEPIPAERRVLITNHDAFGYFADRYDLDVVGAIIPSLTTSADVSASDLDDLTGMIRELGVPAIFAETTESDRLAQALADQVGGDLTIVQLYSGSLGEPGSGAETYLDYLSLNATLIADALA
ncbi:MAG: metal ABC transporter solute-binding protein, Zn/Mn family [Ilumatobacter sp.]|uniref:metal ABC transporter solute-binding protein, Zn/Mn family n=1 Tax=Ilumatobacter sp. TaxID=1967498 RepID=UPI0039197831